MPIVHINTLEPPKHDIFEPEAPEPQGPAVDAIRGALGQYHVLLRGAGFLRALPIFPPRYKLSVATSGDISEDDFKSGLKDSWSKTTDQSGNPLPKAEFDIEVPDED